MQINIIKFYRDHHIPYFVEGTEHTRPGWVQTQCPYCSGRVGDHLGFNQAFGYFNCWRCGPHPVIFTLSRQTGMTASAVRSIIGSYQTRRPVKPVKIEVRRYAFKFPSGTGQIAKAHEKYLVKRNYKPAEVERVWQVMGTGPVAVLDGIDYKFRLVVPIILDNKIVSFQARDITGKARLRYLACPKQRELLDHKFTLYGLDQCNDNERVVIVEGIFDAWRIGPGAVATFGIQYTKQQVHRLVDSFTKALVVYDDELQAQRQARQLQGMLEMYGITTDVGTAPGDPDTFSKKDLDDIKTWMGG